MSAKEALNQYLQGNQRELDLIVHQLKTPNCKDDFMTEIFVGLGDCVSLLHQETFGVVVSALLTVEWSSRSLEMIKSYHSFLKNLVSAYSIYAPEVLKSLVSKFAYKPRKDENTGVILEVFNAERRKTFEEEIKHVHNIIMSVMKAVPMSVQSISKIIKERFPFMGMRDFAGVETFLQNTLYVSLYCPTLRAELLSIVVDKMIYLDVRANRDKIEDAESDSEDESDMEIFDMEGDATPNDSLKTVNKVEEADRLDTIMSVMYNYIDRLCKNPDGSLDWEMTKTLYKELLAIFEKTIFPTHQCCHTQYIMFYICSFKQNLADGFIDYLWKRVKNPNEYQVYRKSAICYMASFIVRAKYISIRTAADAITLMCEWIHKYIAFAHHNTMQNNLQHHGPFYGVNQAVFYMLAFRQKEFLEMTNAQNFFTSLYLQTIVTCRLNPLKVCQPVVTQTFSAFVRKHQLAFCDLIIERNNRLVVPTADGLEDHSTSQYLDSYFPFDPYLLMRSEPKISSIYRTFEGNAIVDIGPANNEGDDDDEFIDHAMSTSCPKSPIDAFFGSISPGFTAQNFLHR